MILRKSPELEKLGKSALIVGVTIGFLLALKWLFPGFNWVNIETAILTGIGTWLVNLVKETNQ